MRVAARCRLRGDAACCPASPGRPGWDPFASPLFRLHVAGVSDRSRPIDLTGRVQLREQHLVQPLPNACFLPDPQPPPTRHPATEAELLRQMLPADPRVQHEQDPLQRQPIVERLAARIPKAALPPRQQRLDPTPHSASDTSHGFARIGIPPKLDDGYRRTSLPRTGSLLSVRASKAKRPGAKLEPMASERLATFDFYGTLV